MPGLDWGRKYERAALSSLELQMGIDIVEPGTMFHPRYSYCSATPDAVFESEIGLISVQVKCPHNGQIHLDSLYNKPILQVGPKGGRRKYWYQVQWEMWVSGAVAALFVSFDPEQPAATKLAVCDIFRDDKMMRTFEHNSLKFRNLFETGLSLSTGTATPIGIPD